MSSREVRDVAGDLLGAELRVAGVDLVLLDVDRREHVVADEALVEMTMASSKLWPFHGMNATSRFLPSASSPWWVDGPSARTSPGFTSSPSSTSGFWLMQVPWFDRRNLLSR